MKKIIKKFMRDDAAVVSLRRATVVLKRIPGFVFVLEPIRKFFSDRKSLVAVSDFDGRFQMKLRLDEHMQSQIFWYGYYSRDIILLMSRLLRPGMVVMDAGANIGEITLAAAKRVGSAGHVYSFEPMQSLYARLQEHVATNCLYQVSPICKGLSDRVGAAVIYRAEAPFDDGTLHDGLGTLYPTNSRSSAAGQIELTTLDAFFAEHSIKRVDLIKVDVEGAELAVLKGGLEAIKRFRPFVILEVQTETSENAGYTPGDIVALMKSLGYSLFVIRRKARLRPLNVSDLASFQNVLCVPTGAWIP